MDPPQTVAELKVGTEARSIETSKFKGYEDKYAIAGAYWPPQYVIMDGVTLEPLKVVSTRGMTYDTQEYHPEPRVASIVASHYNPEFVVNIKETGQILLVNFNDIKNLKVTAIEAERFLHDGGFDKTGRYFLVAANARAQHRDRRYQGRQAGRRDRFRRQDPASRTRRQSAASEIRSGLGDQPSRQRDHLLHRHRSGEAQAECLEGRADGRRPGRRLAVHQDASEVGKSLRRHAAQYRRGNLLLGRRVQDQGSRQGEARIQGASDRSVVRAFPKAQRRVVQGEFNKDGNEIWFSVWNNKAQESAIVVVDDKTLTLKTVIRDKRLVTPTGKFNVYNTRNDIY